MIERDTYRFIKYGADGENVEISFKYGPDDSWYLAAPGSQSLLDKVVQFLNGCGFVIDYDSLRYGEDK